MNNRKYIVDFYSVWAQGTALYVKWASENNISYTELSVLYALITKGITTQKEISEYYGLPKQTVNTVIKGLSERNYIELAVKKEDRREKKILFTEEGYKYANEKLESLFEIEKYISEIISNEQFIQAIETRKLFNILFEKKLKEEKNKEV